MSLFSTVRSLVRTAARSPAVRRGARDLGRAAFRAVKERRSGAEHPGSAAGSGEGALALADRSGAAPLLMDFAPRRDEDADPGEIVWGWVPYEEDLGQGKDRPVLVLAAEDASVGGADGTGEVLIALMLTSRDRAPAGGVATDEHGSTWVDIGSGDWDRRGRDSEVRADRLLRLDPRAVRREGGRLDEPRFDRVVEAVRRTHGW